MARKPAPPKPIGTRLPADWRSTWPGWKVYAMLARIPPDRYDTEALAFERAARGVLSEDWRESWREHCRRVLVERAAPRFDDPLDGLGLFGRP